MNDEKLKRVLNLLPVPETLQARLHANLRECVDSENRNPAKRHKKRYLTGRGVRLIALLVVSAGLFYHNAMPPAYIVAAYEDMRKERMLHGAFDGGSARWLAAHGIKLPPDDIRVDLSKDCRLGTLPSKHLRLVSGAAGNINLFIHSGPSSVDTIQFEQGEWGGQSWLLLKPRHGILVAVLYEHASARPQIIDLVETMFASPYARPVRGLMEDRAAQQTRRI